MQFTEDLLPATARFVILSMLAIIGLASLDLVGAYAARTWAKSGEPLHFAGGAIAFFLLFVLYAKTLGFAEMRIVTLGWIVCIQIGMILIDRLYYHREVPLQTVIIGGVMVLLMGYLMIFGEASHSG